jgi:hypothetical protein
VAAECSSLFCSQCSADCAAAKSLPYAWRSVDLDAGQLSVVASAEQTDDGVREKETKSGKGGAVTLSPTLISVRRYRTEQAQMLLKLGARLATIPKPRI